MIKSMIFIDKFLTDSDISRAEIVRWQVADSFFIADGEEMSLDRRAYTALYGNSDNYRIDKISECDSEGFVEYNVSVPIIEMIKFEGKYPSAYVLSFLSFVGEDAELFYDAEDDVTSVYAPRHICTKYVEVQKNYWHELETQQEKRGVYYS